MLVYKVVFVLKMSFTPRDPNRLTDDELLRYLEDDDEELLDVLEGVEENDSEEEDRTEDEATADSEK